MTADPKVGLKACYTCITFFSINRTVLLNVSISNKRTLCSERIHFLLTVFFFILVCTIYSISRNENVVDQKNKHTVYLIERNE